MTERDLLNTLSKQIDDEKLCFWYKIPDTFGGHKKPFDVMAVWETNPFAIEFKRQSGKLEDHQLLALTKFDVRGDGFSFVATFQKGEKHERDIKFNPVKNGKIIKSDFYLLYWEKGKYLNLPNLFLDLIKLSLLA